MNTTHRKFWLWMVAAFSLGAVAGFMACICLGIILQAMISYAQ
jgi:hypothetical protein